MSDVQREIDKTKNEVAELERSLVEKRAFLAGLERAHKLASKNRPFEPVQLRPGTELYRTQEILKKAGVPLRIEKILEALEKEPTKQNKVSLTGSLASYVRKQSVFTRPGPNTFGLLEFQNNEFEAVNAEEIF